jgi:hypothetical protein
LVGGNNHFGTPLEYLHEGKELSHGQNALPVFCQVKKDGKMFVKKKKRERKEKKKESKYRKPK